LLTHDLSIDYSDPYRLDNRSGTKGRDLAFGQRMQFGHCIAAQQRSGHTHVIPSMDFDEYLLLDQHNWSIGSLLSGRLEGEIRLHMMAAIVQDPFAPPDDGTIDSLDFFQRHRVRSIASLPDSTTRSKFIMRADNPACRMPDTHECQGAYQTPSDEYGPYSRLNGSTKRAELGLYFLHITNLHNHSECFAISATVFFSLHRHTSVRPFLF
jgi:hypothetical protein